MFHNHMRRPSPDNNFLSIRTHGSEGERADFEDILTKRGFRMVHYSKISEVKLPEFTDPVPQPCAVWAK